MNRRHKRRSIRLPGYDYSSSGEYFITICIQDRKCILGEIIDGKMNNHIHGILIIDNPVRAIHELPLSVSEAIHELPLHLQRRKMLLSKIIGRFKMNTGKFINGIRQTSGQPVWQRNYYEHIIRNEKSYDRIEDYIINNPLRWDEDRFKP